MGVTIADIQKLRKLTGAGLADCKKALTEAEGNIDRAIELVRERGLAIAAKRSDRETSNGCVLVKVADNFGAIVALKCETDFVANGKDYIQLTQDILDAAVAAKAKSLEEVKELTLADGKKVETAVMERSGITEEKMVTTILKVKTSIHTTIKTSMYFVLWCKLQSQQRLKDTQSLCKWLL